MEKRPVINAMTAVDMRVQNLEQMIKRLSDRDNRPAVDVVIDGLRSAKWHLWHGCPYAALRRLESLGWDFDAECGAEEARPPATLEDFIR